MGTFNSNMVIETAIDGVRWAYTGLFNGDYEISRTNPLWKPASTNNWTWMTVLRAVLVSAHYCTSNPASELAWYWVHVVSCLGSPEVVSGRCAVGKCV